MGIYLPPPPPVERVGAPAVGGVVLPLSGVDDGAGDGAGLFFFAGDVALGDGAPGVLSAPRLPKTVVLCFVPGAPPKLLLTPKKAFVTCNSVINSL
jgi:hypothetical protein